MEMLHKDAVVPPNSALKTSEKGVEWVSHEELKKEEAKKGPTKQETNEAERKKADERVREQMKRNAEKQPEAKPEAAPATEPESSSTFSNLMKVAAALAVLAGILLAIGEFLGEMYAAGAAIGAALREVPKVRVALGEATEAVKEGARVVGEGAEKVGEVLEEGEELLEEGLKQMRMRRRCKLSIKLYAWAKQVRKSRTYTPCSTNWVPAYPSPHANAKNSALPRERSTPSAACKRNLEFRTTNRALWRKRLPS